MKSPHWEQGLLYLRKIITLLYRSRDPRGSSCPTSTSSPYHLLSASLHPSLKSTPPPHPSLPAFTSVPLQFHTFVRPLERVSNSYSYFACGSLPYHYRQGYPTVGASPIPPPLSDDEPHMRQLWRTTVTTATQSWQNAQGGSTHSAPETVSALRSGPLSNVFGAALSAAESPRCLPGMDGICQVASDSFANVGQVGYVFNDARRNIRGSSTQTVIACRCISETCHLAVLVRPVEIFTHSKGGKVPSGKRICLFEAVDGKFSECHSELLRVTYQDRQKAQEDPGPMDFVYDVTDEHHGDHWTATGRRGISTECLDIDIDELPTVNLSSLKPEELKFNVDRSYDPEAKCHGSGNVQLYRSVDPDDGESCFNIYDKGLSAAAHVASQQDCYAVGKTDGTFMQPATATLVTNMELALSCSAAGLGILFLSSLYRKQLQKVYSCYMNLALVVAFQVASFTLEALPLHIALGSEIEARAWRSLFAFVDVTLALGTGGTAQNGILIMTAVLGELQHNTTRVITVAILTTIFDMIALALVVVTIVRNALLLLLSDGRKPNFHYLEVKARVRQIQIFRKR